MAFGQSNFVILSSAILFNKKSEILLLKRSGKNKTFRGYWQLPEGKIELGEQPFDTLRRELQEELGLKVVSGNLVAVHSCLVNLSNTTYQVIRVAFKINWNVGKLALDREHDDLGWFTPEKVLKLTPIVAGTSDILRNGLFE